MEDILNINLLGGTLSHFNTSGLCIPAVLSDILKAGRTEKSEK